MAWITVIDEHVATGRLRQIYAGMMEPWGGVDNIMKIHSLNPASLTAHHGLYRVLMRGRSPLSRLQREMIAVTVSAVNHCRY